MAIRVNVQDIENYPGVVKTVTVDQEQAVLVGFEGDEQFLLNFSTTAYSDNTARTVIPTLYITDTKAGWCKSSGFVGAGNKFALDATHCKLSIQLDTTTSGHVITLNHDAGIPKNGEDIAKDMEVQIRAVTDSVNPLSYKNASVEFKSGKFWIVTGSVGSDYSITAVRVLDPVSDSCFDLLGFNLPTSSYDLNSVAVKEAAALVYTTNTPTLTIGAGTGVQEGNCLMITDGDTKTDYFTAVSGTVDPVIHVCTSDLNGYVGIKNSYDAGAKVQILREQDPEGFPTMWYESVDRISRYGIKSIINQIDFSS